MTLLAGSVIFSHIPEKLDKSDSPTLFLTGAKELRFARRSAAALAQRMPNAVDGVAIGMDHDGPLHYQDLFSRAVDGWPFGRTHRTTELGPR